MSETERAPRPLRVARVVMWVQAAASAFIAAAQLLDVSELAEHGEDVPGLARFVSIVDPIVVVLLAVAAAVVASRRRWARPLAIGMEVVVLLSAVVNLFSGYVQAVVAFGIAIWVVTLLTRADVTDWLEGRPPARLD